MGALTVAALVAQFRARRYRPALYWVAVVLISIVGTLVTDGLVDGLGVSLWVTFALGYAVALAVFAAAITLVALAYNRGLLAAIPAFAAAYVLTRPLGASIGDLLSQDPADGGLGLGTVATSGAFLLVILALVTLLSRQQQTRLAVNAV